MKHKYEWLVYAQYICVFHSFMWSCRTVQEMQGSGSGDASIRATRPKTGLKKFIELFLPDVSCVCVSCRKINDASAFHFLFWCQD